MDRPKVCIIVPVYNVKDYLEECLVSIISQTNKDFEVLLVDDGSKDGSGKICDVYASKHQFIKVIHKKNGGLSDARNVGLQKAEAEYVTFVDSDDCITTDYIENMILVAEKWNADIVSAGFQRFNNKGKILYERCPRKVAAYSGEKAMEELIIEGEINTMACVKLFKRELFVDTIFPLSKFHEDIFIMHELLHKARKVVTLDKILYRYRLNPKSISEGRFEDKRQDAVEAQLCRYNFIRRYYPGLVNMQTKMLVWNCVNNNIKIILIRIPHCYRHYFVENNKIIKDNIKEFLHSDTSQIAKISSVFCLMLGVFVH